MNKTYCCTDLHGIYNLWEQISNYCDETDTIYFLGDAIDRGKDGIKLMEALLKDKRVIYMMGNHEEFFINNAKNLTKLKGIDKRDLIEVFAYDEDYLLWLQNGGIDTMTSFVYKTRDYQMWMIDEMESIADNFYRIYINKNGQCIHLCHAGTAFNYTVEDLASFGKDNRFLWDRKHFMMPWGNDDRSFVVHGHTPCPIMCKMMSIEQPEHINSKEIVMPSIVNYADGHKFNLDLGAWHTKTVALFDLDELKVEKYFEVEE